jgi:hypothetical protein
MGLSCDSAVESASVSMVKMGRNPQKQAWVRKAKRVKQATQPGKPTAK